MIPKFMKKASDGLYNTIHNTINTKEPFKNGKNATTPAKNKEGAAKVIWIIILIFLFLLFTAPMFYAWYILFKCNKKFDKQMLTEGLILWFLGGLWITNIVYIDWKKCDKKM